MVSFVSGPGSRVEGAPKELVVLSEHDPAWLEMGAELVAGLRALLAGLHGGQDRVHHRGLTGFWYPLMMRVIAFMYGDEQAEAGDLPTGDIVNAMIKYNEDLNRAGVLLATEGLHPTSRGRRVTWTTFDKTTVVDGPFAEAKEVIAGYWIWQVRSMAEAVEWAKRCPLGPGGRMELREIFEMSEFGDSLTDEQRRRDDAVRAEVERQHGAQ